MNRRTALPVGLVVAGSFSVAGAAAGLSLPRYAALLSGVALFAVGIALGVLASQEAQR